MDAEFWLACWQNDHLGFQLDDVHPMLQELLPQLALPTATKVFVPLCGKSLDLAFLAKSYSVVGAELSDIACRDFFAQHQLEPSVSEATNNFRCYQTEQITIWNGDFFNLPKQAITECQFIYDRAALVALPEAMRLQYAAKLLTLFKAGTKMLLISVDYPQDEKVGPPFSVSKLELEALFPSASIKELAVQDLTAKGFAKRKFSVSKLIETAYLISFN
ncbi:thiopurine S-methyltransferase [Rheinheimera sp. MMS21-TC3]|uniref:thiopurine S-methyltransferase n=1 Tax=Rheinheimera sp. MMS21-TC3 TaxID=3072790 RepID=UPI0028C3F5DE|nr:thiopurine S-methyltransferase [Rheinheimera sp. MMS21-TC3]WNO61863.1 thiopurine S-methyltransferase [Rheinheimera sp. MMS21-TC3]